MAHHITHLNPEPFEKIKSGRKDVELRINDPKRKAMQVGDTLEFIHRGTDEKMLKTLVKRHDYQTFYELLQNVPPERCGYEGEYLTRWQQHADHGMHVYYSPEEEKQYGVVGLELSP